MKKIGIMTTGGDCSGLNTAIHRITIGARRRGWNVVGILDGTDGLASDTLNIIELGPQTLPIELARLSGSVLGNGRSGAMNFETAARDGKLAAFNKKVHKSLTELKLDALVLIGGNGSLSLAHNNREIYANVQLVCMPKTIDMDVPKTDATIGFATAVQSLVSYCDQLLLTARSHHRWFVVQAMGRDCGNLALSAGVALGADAVLVPEIKFDTAALIKHIKDSTRDYGIIIVGEGITMRGHSGRPADMISRELTRAGLTNRAVFPEHIQRAGDTAATDRLLAAAMADCALNAIENNETNVMVSSDAGRCKTISLAEFFAAGDIRRDPKIPDMQTSDAYIDPTSPLLQIADNMGIYIGIRS